jgi:hypothetical protein
MSSAKNAHMRVTRASFDALMATSTPKTPAA